MARLSGLDAVGVVFMDGQAQPGEEVDNFLSPIAQPGFIVVKEEKIVDVAQVSLAFELAFDEMIELVQVHIGPELAGQVADGQPARAGD